MNVIRWLCIRRRIQLSITMDFKQKSFIIDDETCPTGRIVVLIQQKRFMYVVNKTSILLAIDLSSTVSQRICPYRSLLFVVSLPILVLVLNIQIDVFG
jgi:hypothetical protein